MKRKFLAAMSLVLCLEGCASSLLVEGGLLPYHVAPPPQHRQVGWAYVTGDPVLPYYGYYNRYAPPSYDYCFYCY